MKAVFCLLSAVLISQLAVGLASPQAHHPPADPADPHSDPSSGDSHPPPDPRHPDSSDPHSDEHDLDRLSPSALVRHRRFWLCVRIVILFFRHFMRPLILAWTGQDSALIVAYKVVCGGQTIVPEKGCGPPPIFVFCPCPTSHLALQLLATQINWWLKVTGHDSNGKRRVISICIHNKTYKVEYDPLLCRLYLENHFPANILIASEKWVFPGSKAQLLAPNYCAGLADPSLTIITLG